ncbi:hypothetical protein ABT160_31605 [Streptomyces sp. NPDC001941]|uniref:hypothetical protein n=1 Tax=Streptomyces sp. NPDC001941 TaxID=3154659 RepID=UPI003318F763
MLRHEFRPGRLIAGLTALGIAAAFAGDAAGEWDTPWFVVVPVLTGGLVLAGTATWIAYGMRRRRALRAASRESTEAPASTSGSQAIR